MTPDALPPTSALLLDLDGVVVNSAASQVRAWQWWCRFHGLDAQPFLAAHGMTGADKVAVFAPASLGLCPETEATRVTGYEVADSHDVTAYEGAVELLASRQPVAIVTSARSCLAVARLRAAGLFIPDVLIGAEMVTHGKPHPEPFQLAARRLKVNSDCCIVIEDSPVGIRAAKLAGMRVVALTTTLRAQFLHEADRIIPNLAAYSPQLTCGPRSW